MTNTVAAASVLPVVGALASDAAQGGQANQNSQGPRNEPRPQTPPQNQLWQGGTGPISVLLIDMDHPFDRDPYFEMFDSLGHVINWTHVQQPAAELMFTPKMAERYDVFVLYDRAGRRHRSREEGRVNDPGDRTPRDVDFVKPSPELQAGLKAILQRGDKGFVFFHHSLASWVHTWPQYVEVVGAAADWDYPMTVRGKQYPYSGFRGGVQQHITIVDKSHPVVQGLGDGFDIVDETYLCPMFEDSVHCLMRTDFKPIDSNFPMQYSSGWHHPPGSNMTGWVKTAENTPIVYIQHGHGPTAWENPAFRKLMTNAIQWVNSPEAKAWAKKNPSRIFT
jgi:type 1 glutamine amidotransferase